MSVAVKTEDGKIFVEGIDCVPQSEGFGWMVSFLEKCKHVDRIVIDGKGKADLMLESLKNSAVKAKAVIPTVSEAIVAYSAFKQAIDEETILHCRQPSVLQAVANCEKRLIGSNGGFGYRSMKTEIDVSIVESLALAHWLCSSAKTKRRQHIGY
jgi:hypothetical protein